MSKKSKVSLSSVSAGALNSLPEVDETPLDTLNIKINSLRLPDENPKLFVINVTYFDQLILSGVIRSIGARDVEQNRVLAQGTMSYDPSDYEKMCLFADCPLVVNIHPPPILESLVSEQTTSTSQMTSRTKSGSTKSASILKSTDPPTNPPTEHISCCNVDILSIFLGDEENTTMRIKKRMEPKIKPPVLQCKSWDCLPLLTMEICVTRHKDNAEHHKHLKEANWLKLTLVAAYNLVVPFDNELVYTAITKTPLYCEYNTGLAQFNEGSRVPKKFNPTNFNVKWESLNVGENIFAKADTKFTCDLSDIRNEDNIDLLRYMIQRPQDNTIVWASFHRSMLIKKSSEEWFAKQIQQYKWPLEIHIQSQDATNTYSFMAFLNLFNLLYPGEKNIRLAVPLLWYHETTMIQECNCSSLLGGNIPPPSSTATVAKPDKNLAESSDSTELTAPVLNNTGADDNPAFVIVEVKLARALKKVVKPTRMTKSEIDAMLKASESMGTAKRRCTGRVAFARSWQSSVQLAATALRRVPYFGTTEFSVFVRQLSETKTRVELTTTCWQDGALFVNNNFVVQQYLHSEEIFEEIVMMTHACLVRLACDNLLENNQEDKDVDPVLRAARQARQMRDNHHAMDLYLQVTVNKPQDPNVWRELSTCLKDIDRDWAKVSLNHAVVLNPRHPLTLVSTCGMVFEEDPVAAEQFFEALLAFYPFWVMGWIIASVYYYDRQQYLIFDIIMRIIQKSQREGQTEEIPYARGWERELGDWWDSTQLLPGMSPFYDAADVLLRLRCITLAELCLARALSQVGESSVYYHLIALCCRLRGEYNDALCHLQTGISKYGNVSYLKSLEAECYHMLGNIHDSMVSFEKCNSSRWPHTVLMMQPIFTDPIQRRAVLWDLVRRHPCAYSWMALAESCSMIISKYEKSSSDHSARAVACAVQALKWDRLAGSAWAFLANNVKPSARRYYCAKMAALSIWPEYLRVCHALANKEIERAPLTTNRPATN